MAEENGKDTRDRKVIPYEQAFGAQNSGLTESDEGNRVRDELDESAYLNDSYQGELMREDPTEEEEISSPLGAAEPIGRNDRDPEDIRSEREDVEAAEEIADPMPRSAEEPADEGRSAQGDEGRGLGIAGIILSLVSIFILPAVLAPAGIIVGYLAFRQGSRTTGIWAMVIGAFSLLMALLVLPAYFR